MENFNISHFLPHGQCYDWSTDVIVLNVLSDFIIALCYLSIPAMLTYILLKRREFPFRRIIWVFITFIFFCSLTHIIDIINVWNAYFYLSGAIKAITAVISLISTWLILKNLRNLLTVPTYAQLQNRLNNQMVDIMEVLPLGIIFCSHDGKIEYANKYIEGLFGYKSDEVSGKEVEIFLPKELHKSHIIQRSEYAKDPKTRLMGEGRVLQGIAKNGKTLDLEIALRPFKGASGKDLLIVAIKDVTEAEKYKNELDKSTELIRYMSENLPSILSYLDADGIYQFANSAYFLMYPDGPNHVLGKNYRDVLPKEILEKVEKKILAAFHGSTETFHIRMKTQSGLRDLTTYYVPHKGENGSVKGIIVHAYDQTEVLTAKRELEVTNSQLQDYAFLVSHDLRAPVRHIASFSDLLIKELKNRGELTEKEIKYSEILIQNAEKIQLMISGLLKIASIYQIKPVFEKIDIKEFFSSFRSFHRLPSDIVLESKSPTIISDREILLLIFNNLVENSRKHGEKSHLEIRISFTHVGHDLVVDYYDNGPGIADDSVAHVFDAFIKGNESNGLGLGLNIVKRSVEKLNGHAVYLSDHQGAHFRIFLPYLD